MAASVDGMVARPGTLSLIAAEELPVAQPDHAPGVRRGLVVYRRVDGVPLPHVLDVAGTLPQAKYVVYYSIDQKVGKHRYGRCAASADAPHLRDERRRSASRPWRAAAVARFRANSATRA